MAVDFKPEIGKNVIETLTLGMYDNPRFIYREYIQNAADQIDVAVELNILKDKNDGLITIQIDPQNKIIEVIDNATGIHSADVLQFLGDVANSQKDGSKRRGFRGIGRLGGLGYCNKLTFVTSYKGEAQLTKMILDANLLRLIIKDRANTSDAAKVISLITSIQSAPENVESHYFKVIMEGVTDLQLLNSQDIFDYLGLVAPVPFHEEFTFAADIKSRFMADNVIMEEYAIFINNEQLFKSYRNQFQDEKGQSNLIGIDFIEFRDTTEELLALCWYGYRDHSNLVLVSKERGIRIRTKNITIGDELTSNRFFDQARTNQRFIGEIHTLSDNFIPNARRDYFEENSIVLEFSKIAKIVFEKENLENRLAQTASQLYNRKKEIDSFIQDQKEFDEKKASSFENAAQEIFYANKLKGSLEKAVRANRVLKNLRNKGDKDQLVKNLYDQIVGILPDSSVLDKYTIPQLSQYNPPLLNLLQDAEKKIVLEIFEILEKNLPFEASELIKKKIIEKYNK